MQEENKKSISRDAWQQLWHFMLAYPKDLKDYDPNSKCLSYFLLWWKKISHLNNLLALASSWPLLFDDFVNFVQTKDPQLTTK